MAESRCGACCADCARRSAVRCGGCAAMKRPYWGGVCAVKSCCERRGLAHCGLCGDFPCAAVSALGTEQGLDPAPRLQACRDRARFDRLEFRALAREEFGAALALAERVFLQYEAPGYSEQGVRNFRRALRDPVYVRQLRVFAAFDGRDVAGMLATRDGGGHVALFFVGAAYQRIGVGRALFGMALRAHPEGMTVNAAPFAVGFYHRLGFADTGAETVTDGIRYTPMQYRPAAAAGGAL